MSDNESVPGFRTSPQIGELTKALATAHKKFKPVIKDTTNPFYKSKYADLAGVIEATSEALSENGLVVIQSPGKIELGYLSLTTLLSHSSGEWIRDQVTLPVTKLDAQGAGIAITYARRYAYQAIVGVAAEDDDGNTASGKFEKQPDGNFVRKTDNPSLVQGLVQGSSAGPRVSTPDPKPAAKAKAKVPPTPPNSSVSGQNSVPATGNVHGLDITDADLPDNMQPDRECTPEEHDAFRKRFIALKDKGYQNIGVWLIKTSGKPRTQDIGFGQTKKLVEQLEAADVAGTLKELLARD